MDLLKMTKRAQIHEFVRRLNRGNYYLSSLGALLGVWKLASHTQFQHSVSKLCLLGKKRHSDMRSEYNNTSIRRLTR